MRLFQRHNSPYWQLDYFYRGKRYQKSTQTLDYREALKIKIALQLKLEKAPLARIIMSLDELCVNYMQWYRSERAASSSDRVRQVLTNLLTWCETRATPIQDLHELTLTRIEDYLEHRRGSGVAEGTIKKEAAVIKAMFNWAIKRKIVERSPATYLTTKPAPPKPFRLLTKDEIAELLEMLRNCQEPENATIVDILLRTGMRIGEFKNLRWEDIDFENMEIRIVSRPTAQTKTRKSRIIPMEDKLENLFKSLRTYEKSKEVCPFSFTWNCGAIGRALRKVGIKDGRAHVFRHTFASFLVNECHVDIETARDILGHSSILMTQRYLHTSPRHRREAIKALSEILSE